MDVYQRRRLVALGAVVVVIALIVAIASAGGGGSDNTAVTTTSTAAASKSEFTASADGICAETATAVANLSSDDVAQQVSLGWWPGDRAHDSAAFFALAYPTPDSFGGADLSPAPGAWDAEMGEYLLAWDEIRDSPDAHSRALDFARVAFRHACHACDWDPALAATAQGVPPPIH